MQRTTKVGFLFLTWMIFGAGSVYASCSVSSDSSYLSPNTTDSMVISVSNTGSNIITWVKMPINFSSSWSNVSPDIQDSGWGGEFGSEQLVFAGGDIPVGQSVSFNISGTTGGEGESFDWTWETAPNSDGSGAETCNTLGFSITSNPPTPSSAPTPTPVLSELAVSAGASSATITWRTDLIASSVVTYGTTSGYGSSATGTSGVQVHSVSLSGLTPSTTYHFSVSSANDNGTTTSSDNTFTTGAAGTTTTVTTTVTNTETVTATVSKTVILADTIKPVVKVDTKLDKAVAQAPIIEGKVVDSGAVNVGIVKIQYSVDNGKSWLLVDEPSGATKAEFSFVPEVYEDGNYQILVRATDKSGNTGVSSMQTLVIDRLPPRIIHSLLRVGPIILSAPYQLVAGVKTQVSVQAIGGVTEMRLEVGNQKVELLKNFETGLWENEIVIQEMGEWDVVARAIDGGGNEIEQKIAKVNVSSHTGCLTCQMTIYRYDDLTKRFKVWNGEVYDQVNPSTGKSSWYLPTGKYYIEAKQKGYQASETKIFNLDVAGVVGVTGEMQKINLWNWWKRGELILDHSNIKPLDHLGIIGKQITWIEKTEWRGKDFSLTIVPLWEPRVAEILSEQGEDSVVVIAGANQSSVDLLKNRGSYKMEMRGDPDGEILSDLEGVNLPITLTINRRGQVERVK